MENRYGWSDWLLEPITTHCHCVLIVVYLEWNLHNQLHHMQYMYYKDAELGQQDF